MTPEQKRIALEALRSGKYRQHKGMGLVSQDGTTMCLIGIMGHANGIDVGRGSRGGLKVITCEVAERLGLGTNYGDLIRENDDPKKTLEDLADYVEEHY